MLLVLLGDWDFVVCACSVCEKVCLRHWREGEKGHVVCKDIKKTARFGGRTQDLTLTKGML